MRFGSLTRGVAITTVGAVAFVVAMANPGLAPPGDLDPTFDGDGKVTTEFSPGDRVLDHIRDIAIQSDGRIVAVGSTLVFGTEDFALARYNPNGSLDATFGGDGKVITGIGSTDLANAVAIQGDGKIVAAGLARVSANDEFAVARYNSDGTLDTTFGEGDGKVTTDFGSGSIEQASGVAIQEDGKIVAAGSAVISGTRVFAIARFSLDGTLDTSFGGGDGKVTTGFASGDSSEAFDMVIQEDGKIVTAGVFVPAGTLDFDFALIRYEIDGSPDTSFGGGDGKVTTAFVPGSREQVNSVVIQEDGKIVAVGCFFCLMSPGTALALARYNTDGSLDSTFDGDGIATTDLGSPNSQAFDAAIQADAKIVVAGCVFCGSVDADFSLARFHPDASLDASFGGGDGKVTTDIAFGRDEATSIAIQPDRKIVAAGCAFCGSDFGDFALTRYKICRSTSRRSSIPC